MTRRACDLPSNNDAILQQIRLKARQDARLTRAPVKFTRVDYQLTYDNEYRWFSTQIQFGRQYAKDPGTFLNLFTSK